MVRVGQGIGSAELRKSENVNPLADQDAKTSMHQNVKPSISQNVNTENRQSVKTDHLPFEMNALLKELKGFIRATVHESMGMRKESVKTSNRENVNPSKGQNVMPLITDESVSLDLEEEHVDIEEEGQVEQEKDQEEEEKEDIYRSSRQNVKPLAGQKIKKRKEGNIKASKSQNVMAVVALSEESEKTESRTLIKPTAKKEKMEQTDPKPSLERKEEKQYVSYYPEFLVDIYDHFNLLGRDLLFLEKERSFPGKSKQVGWVSVRYRSLLENLLTLSEMNRVHLSDLVEVTNAFTLLIRSRSYAELPGNYPYSASIKVLREKLRALCVEYKDEESIRFRIPLSLKKDLLLYRLELSQSFPKKPFCKLTFNEDKR